MTRKTLIALGLVGDVMALGLIVLAIMYNYLILIIVGLWIICAYKLAQYVKQIPK